ncbi:hypothetical protein MKW98_017298 [Papaver atlanticum]|uniref:Uncharacterized protein n=1 Tax=Papaver atlanticum TaxID=357466 RepID=A0AAD4XJG8_9MAGN|nr:hypothetical protein MKW98_017298 [Papaver atlanticum]
MYLQAPTFNLFSLRLFLSRPKHLELFCFIRMVASGSAPLPATYQCNTSIFNISNFCAVRIVIFSFSISFLGFVSF